MELCRPYRTSATVCYAKDKADALSFAMPPVPGFYITILTRIFAQQTALQAMLSNKRQTEQTLAALADRVCSVIYVTLCKDQIVAKGLVFPAIFETFKAVGELIYFFAGVNNDVSGLGATEKEVRSSGEVHHLASGCNILFHIGIDV